MSNEIKTGLYEGKVVHMIDLTPTWSHHLSTLLLLLQNADRTGRSAAIEELKNMAKVADKYNELVKEYNEDMELVRTRTDLFADAYNELVEENKEMRDLSRRF